VTLDIKTSRISRESAYCLNHLAGNSRELYHVTMQVVQAVINGRNRWEGRFQASFAAIRRSVWVTLLVSRVAGSALGAVFPTAKPEWSVEFGNGTIGPPAQFGSRDQTRGILLTLHGGQILLLGPTGEKQATMTVDLPIETPAVAADLLGDGHLAVVAVDTWGSVYCFDASGRRRWKYSRTVQSGEFRVPVFADLAGKGKLDILVTDSRGHLEALDAEGRLRLEITATRYRVSVPAVGDINGDGRPELIFGTEAGETYCVSAQGDVLWSTLLDGCFTTRCRPWPAGPLPGVFPDRLQQRPPRHVRFGRRHRQTSVEGVLGDAILPFDGGVRPGWGWPGRNPFWG
jgi:hypothetical protein